MAGKNRANKYSGQKVNLGALYGGGGDTESIFEELTTTAEALPIDPNDDSGAGQMAEPVTTTKQGKLIGFADKRSFLDKIAGKTNTASALNSQLALDQARIDMTEAGLTSRQRNEIASKERISTAEQSGATERGNADNASKKDIAKLNNLNTLAVEQLRIDAGLKDLQAKRDDTKQAVLDGRISTKEAAEQRAQIDKKATKLNSRLKINEDKVSTDNKTLASVGFLTSQKDDAANPLLQKALSGVRAVTAQNNLNDDILAGKRAVVPSIPVDTFRQSLIGPMLNSTADNIKNSTLVIPKDGSVLGVMPQDQFRGVAGSPASTDVGGRTTAATLPTVEGMSPAASQSIGEFMKLKAAGGIPTPPTKPPVAITNLVTPPVDEEDEREKALTKRLLDSMKSKKTTATPAPTLPYYNQDRRQAY